MLQQLIISHFALIDHLALDFSPGFTVLSGETGAGKSIIIDALSLVLGERADSQAISAGAKRADITAVFAIANVPAAQQWLIESALDHQDDCILRRSITRDGRSQAYINDHPTTLNQLKQLSLLLLALHGQHQQQALLENDFQRTLVDAFAKTTTLSAELNNYYRQYQKTQTALQELHQREQQQRAERELLRYQMEEITALNLTEGEIPTLTQQHQQLTHATDINLICQEIINVADENIVPPLHHALQQLSHYTKLDPQLAEAAELFNQSVINIEEANRSLQNYAEKIDLNPNSLAQIEERLSALHAMARKHHVAMEKLPEFFAELTARWQVVQQDPENRERLQEQLAALEKNYQKTADILTEKRRIAANKLAKAVNEHLHQLGMINAELTIMLEPHAEKTPHPFGNEQVSFYIQTNRGHAAGPLNKIASGGELSRIALAIDVVTATTHAVPTIIFDEVDTGISGVTAAVIGQLLRKLGRSAQVFSVTHLPQVAAHADQHIRIQKNTAAEHATTSAQVLNAADHLDEVARLLGGLKITEQTRLHAEELIAEAVNAIA